MTVISRRLSSRHRSRLFRQLDCRNDSADGGLDTGTFGLGTGPAYAGLCTVQNITILSGVHFLRGTEGGPRSGRDRLFPGFDRGP
jgi:hypothetical protein